MSTNSRVPASGELLKTDGTIINQADVLADVYDTGTHSIRAKLETEGVTFEVNEADLAAVRTVAEDAHDADNHALRVHETAAADMLAALGLVSTADKQDALLTAIGLLSKLTDTQPVADSAVLAAVGLLAKLTDTQPVVDSTVATAVGLLAKLTDTQPVKVADDAFALSARPIIRTQSIGVAPAQQILYLDDAGVQISLENIKAVSFLNEGSVEVRWGTAATMTAVAKSRQLAVGNEVYIPFGKDFADELKDDIWFLAPDGTGIISVTIELWA